MKSAKLCGLLLLLAGKLLLKQDILPPQRVSLGS